MGAFRFGKFTRYRVFSWGGVKFFLCYGCGFIVFLLRYNQRLCLRYAFFNARLDPISKLDKKHPNALPNAWAGNTAPEKEPMVLVYKHHSPKKHISP